MAGSANNGNGLSHHIYSHPAKGEDALREMIRLHKLTGSMTIHFSNGVPSGMIEWKEKLSANSSSPSESFGPISSLIKK